MNSNQRRKDKRKWKYNVRYTYTEWDRYDEMWNWLCATYGNLKNHVWRERHGYIGDWWQFEDEEAMTMFVLKFGPGDYYK
jgi:hypothetical protein